MSQILKRVAITSSVLAGYAAAAGLIAFVGTTARGEVPAKAQQHAAEETHAPITSAEGAQSYVQHLLPNVHVAAAYLDAKPEPHFHVELRLADGRTARLDVDPRTGALGWRNPPILED